MKIYRLDKRFVFQAIGINLLMAGVVLAASMFLSSVLWQSIALVGAAVLLGRAVWLWVRPPVVARTDDEGVTLGGRLTVKPISLAWTDVQDVSSDAQRVYLDRGTDRVLAFPLAFAGRRGPELLRDLYDRLNTAHGYERFDPS